MAEVFSVVFRDLIWQKLRMQIELAWQQFTWNFWMHYYVFCLHPTVGSWWSWWWGIIHVVGVMAELVTCYSWWKLMMVWLSVGDTRKSYDHHSFWQNGLPSKWLLWRFLCHLIDKLQNTFMEVLDKKWKVWHLSVFQFYVFSDFGSWLGVHGPLLLKARLFLLCVQDS